MKSIEVKGTARTIAERSSEQARALKLFVKTTVYLAYFMVQVKMFTSLYLQRVCVTWFTLRTST